MPEVRPIRERDPLDGLRKKIERGKRVTYLLPGDGRFMMDRPLPFICIYRSPQHADPGVEELVRAQTAYLRASDSPAQLPALRELLTTVIAAVTKASKAFLLIEVWAADKAVNPDTFKALCPVNNLPSTAAVLEQGLNELAARVRGAKAELVDTLVRHPPGLEPLFPMDELKKMGAITIGIEVPPLYWSAEGLYSRIAMRVVRNRLTDVIKRTVFDLIRVQTPLHFPHYLTLGRTSITRSALNIDRRLARIGASFDVLLNVSPVNTEEAWQAFERGGRERPPEFNYRLIPVDPEIAKRQLFQLRIGEVEDNALEFIFRDKRNELETQLTLLSDRGTSKFLYSSLRLYGAVEAPLLQKATSIIDAVARRSAMKGEKLDAQEFAAMARAEIERYRVHFPELTLGVRVRNDVDGVLVSNGQVHIGETFTVARSRAYALLQHEVGTHVLTYCNGQRQPLKLLSVGLAGYDQLQEGLAVLAEYLCGGLGPERLKLLAARVIAVDAMVKGASFIDCHRMLISDLGYTGRKAFMIATRVYRGKGSVKDAAYLRGLDLLIEHLRKSPLHLDLLYTGKFGLRHIKLMEDLQLRGVLHPPVLPLFLDEVARERIDAFKNAQGLDPLLSLIT
jgi:uncharacterized protein (TIGR02421 family)